MGKTAFSVPRGNFWKFDPKDLVLIEDESHPLYDARVNLPLDESLVLNIMLNGVIEPVVIRKTADGAEVIDGRQRVRAAREANKRLAKAGNVLHRVAAIVRKGSESDLFGVAISANENRQDDTPMGRAAKAVKLLNMGQSEEEVAIAFGVTVQSVKNWCKLAGCTKAVQKAVESGQVSATAAYKLAELPAKEQGAALSELRESAPRGKKPTVAKAAAKVAKKKGKPNGIRMRSRKVIVARIKETEHLPPVYLEALCWVLSVEPDFFDK